MAEERVYVQHLRSADLVDGAAKVPPTNLIKEGEIAVGINTAEPAMFLKTTNNTIAKFNAVTRDEIKGMKDRSEEIDQKIDREIGSLSNSTTTSINNLTQTVSNNKTDIEGKVTALGTETDNKINALKDSVEETYAHKDGTYEELTAGLSLFAEELSGSSTDKIEDSGEYVIRTTAGALDVRSDEPMYLVDIKPFLTENNQPWTGTAFRFNGFNALNPLQVINSASVSGGVIVSDATKKIAYFRCVRGEWGTYGKSDKNNGYLLTSREGTRYSPAGVYECATLPAVGASVTSVDIHNEQDYVYYLPNTSGDYLCIVVPASASLADICAHIAWSNKDDDKFADYAAETINLRPYINQMNGISTGDTTSAIWLAGIRAGHGFVSDEINISLDVNGSGNSVIKTIKRVGRKTLTSLPWTVEEIQSTGEGGTVSYKFSAQISDMDVDGMVQIGYNGIVYEDNILSYTSSDISTVDAFIALLGSAYAYYQYDQYHISAWTGTIKNVYHGDDMGTEEVIGAEKANAVITTAYVIGLKDYLRGLPAELHNYTRVIAEHICEIKDELDVLKRDMGEVEVGSINFPMFEPNMLVGSYKFFSQGHGTPWAWTKTTQDMGLVETRGFGPCIGAEYYDLDDDTCYYKCVNVTAATASAQWKKVVYA